MIKGYRRSLKVDKSGDEFFFPVEMKKNTLEVSFPEELNLRYIDLYFNQIENIHSQMLRENIDNIDIDVSKLVFINSRGIKMFIDWIYNILSLPPDHRYSLTFYINKNIIWQQEGINILADLAPGIIKVLTKK